MSLPVKLGLATVGAAGVTTTAYYGGGFLLNKSTSTEEQPKEMPSWRPLVEDSEFLSGENLASDFLGKYAADKARLLVGTGADSDEAKAKNKDWWDWSFRNSYPTLTEGSKGDFDDLKIGAKKDGEAGKSLQEACEKAYKAETTKIKTGKSDTIGTGEFKEEHIWTLCSAVGRSKPKTIEEAEKGENSTAKTKLATNGEWQGKLGETKKADLLDIDSPENVKAWDELNKQYEKENPTEGFFKSDGANTKVIKVKCGEAYAKANVGNTDADPKDTDLYKWCSLKGRKAS